MKHSYIQAPTYKRETLLLEDPLKQGILIREDCEDPYWVIPHAITTRNQALFETALSASTLPSGAIRHWRNEMYAPDVESKESEDCLASLGVEASKEIFVCEFSNGSITRLYAKPMERWQEAERLLFHTNRYYKTSLTITRVRRG